MTVPLNQMYSQPMKKWLVILNLKIKARKILIQKKINSRMSYENSLFDYYF